VRGRLWRQELRLARVRDELARSHDEQGRSPVDVLRERRRRRIAEARGVSVEEVMQEELAAASLADKRLGEQKPGDSQPRGSDQSIVDILRRRTTLESGPK
jgi:hypothetical protein